MEKLKLAYCGYDCNLCAARSDDPELRQKLVEGWKKIFGHENYTAENVHCDGCRVNGRLADKNCQARPCARERVVESCVLCDDFICDKVRPLITDKVQMLTSLHQRLKDITEEEYELCMRQFESRPRLLKILIQAGKLPDWADKEK